MIFDIAVDAAAGAVPEGIVPAPIIAAAPAEARPAEGRAPAEAAIAEGPVIIERVGRVADLAAVDAVAELHDHVRALRVGRGREATGLQLLRDEPGVTLELEPAIVRHPAARHDIEGLALRGRHRL